METEKIIEEMANILETRIVNKTWRSKSVAREIYRMIVPEGAVVLTMKEKNALWYEAWTKAYDKARKETARGILTETEWLFRFCGQLSYLDELAKYFGVEVE